MQKSLKKSEFKGTIILFDFYYVSASIHQIRLKLIVYVSIVKKLKKMWFLLVLMLEKGKRTR